MNTLKTGLTSAILAASLLCGADSMDVQIQAIQNASPQERVELMNNFKAQIASMNEEGRASAIGTLRREMNARPTAQGAPPVTQRTQPMQRMQSMQQMQSIQQGAITQRIGDDTLMAPATRPTMTPITRPIIAPTTPPTTAPIIAPITPRR